MTLCIQFQYRTSQLDSASLVVYLAWRLGAAVVLVDLFVHVLIVLVRIRARSALNNGMCMLNAAFDFTNKVLITETCGLSRSVLTRVECTRKISHVG